MIPALLFSGICLRCWSPQRTMSHCSAWLPELVMTGTMVLLPTYRWLLWTWKLEIYQNFAQERGVGSQSLWVSFLLCCQSPFYPWELRCGPVAYDDMVTLYSPILLFWKRDVENAIKERRMITKGFFLSQKLGVYWRSICFTSLPKVTKINNQKHQEMLERNHSEQAQTNKQ